MSENKNKKAAAVVLAALVFFFLGLAAGFLMNLKKASYPPVRTEFRNPDGPPRIKGPTTPPPKF